MRTTIFFLLLGIWLFIFGACRNPHAQSDKRPFEILPFEAIILTGVYPSGCEGRIFLTEKGLKIIRAGKDGGRDSVVFYQELKPSDTLRQISEIKIRDLKEEYANQCMHDDGLQFVVVFRKQAYEKHIFLDNFYQEDIGKMIGLVNSIVPECHRIPYNRKELLAAQKKCGQ